jgi:hypothetical protein
MAAQRTGSDGVDACEMFFQNAEEAQSSYARGVTVVSRFRVVS